MDDTSSNQQADVTVATASASSSLKIEGVHTLHHLRLEDCSPDIVRYSPWRSSRGFPKMREEEEEE